MELVQCALHPHRAGREVDVPTLETEHLAPTQCPPGGHDDGCTVLLRHRLGEGGHLVDVGDGASITLSAPPPFTRHGFFRMKSSEMAVLKMALRRR